MQQSHSGHCCTFEVLDKWTLMPPRSAAPRRRMTLVHAVKRTFHRASSTRSHNNGSTTSPVANAPSSQHSSPLLPRNASYRSASSLDGITRQSSGTVDSTQRAMEVPVVHTEPPPPQQQQRRVPPPEALPTHNFYKRFPHAVGPLANVLISSPEEYSIFCLTARCIQVVANRNERNVEKDRLTAEDIAKGGFFVYQPNSETPRYFLLYDNKEDVYGTSNYIPSKR